MIILLIILLIIAAILAIKKPSLFVIYYLISASKFLGFLNTPEILISNTSVYLFLLNVITMVSSIMRFTYVLKLSKKNKLYVFLILLFLVYGILRPYLFNYSTLVVALVGSKQFWFYSLLIYVLTYSHSVDFRKIFNFVEYLGLYLSLVFIFFLIFKVVPPAYYEFKLGIGFYPRVYYPTFISLALFLCYSKWNQKLYRNVNFCIRTFILFCGLVLAGHMSIVVGTVLSLIALFFFRSRSRFRVYFWGTYCTLCFALAFVALVPGHVQDRIYQSTNNIIERKSAALTSRDSYDEFRWELIEGNPVIGYGFIHKSSSLIQNTQYSNSIYSESLSVIDSGYVDLFGKFGFIGGGMFLFIFLMIISPIIFNHSDYCFLYICLALFVVQYYLVNITWSVFSFEHGIVPLCLCLAFILIGKDVDPYWPSQKRAY